MSTEIQVSILALEEWLRICLAYLGTAPEYPLDSYECLMRRAVADQALKVAKYDVAAHGHDGNMVYGLVNALPIILERRKKLDNEMISGVKVRTEVIAGNAAWASPQIMSALIGTVERAIDDLREGT